MVYFMKLHYVQMYSPVSTSALRADVLTGEGEGGLFLVSRWDGLRGDTHLFVPCSALVSICILISF